MIKRSFSTSLIILLALLVPCYVHTVLDEYRKKQHTFTHASMHTSLKSFEEYNVPGTVCIKSTGINSF